MRVVPTKTPEQQASLVLHRTRRLFILQQIAIMNSICSHLAEFGIGLPRKRGVEPLLQVLADSNDARLPEMARACIAALGVQSRHLKAQIFELKRWQR
jgi:transposase